MLREDATRNHRITINYVRSLLTKALADGDRLNAPRIVRHNVAADLKALDIAAEAHIKAHTAFDTFNSDETMVNLIGTWARVTKVMRDIDDKYGDRT